MLDTLSPLSYGLLPSAGYTAESTDWSGITNLGMDSIGIGPTPPAPNQGETVDSSQTYSQNVAGPTINQLTGISSSSYDPSAPQIVPTSTGYTNIGSAINSGMNLGQYLGAPNIQSTISPDGMSSTFTGTDLKLLIECTAVGQPNQFKQLIECHTISVSSYRMKTPVRALGYTNPKGFSRGLRTIAGTMILTELTSDILLSFLQAIVIQDTSKDSQFTKVDQLPAFNITMVFANEEGFASSRTLQGVEFLNDGTIYSIQDLLTERTISWMAADFTPLIPLDTSSLYVTNGVTAASQTETTPTDLMTGIGGTNGD